MGRKSIFPSGQRRKVVTVDDARKLQYLLCSLHSRGHFFSERIFEISLQYLSSSRKKRLLDGLLRYANPNGLNSESYQDFLDKGIHTHDEILISMSEKPRISGKIFHEIVIALEHLLTQKKFNGKISNLQKKLEEVQKLFGLSRTERDIIELLYSIQTDTLLEIIHDELCENLEISQGFMNTTKHITPLAIMTGYSYQEIRRAFSGGSTLVKYQLIDSDFELTPEIRSFLAGFSKKPITQYYFTEFTGNAIPIEQHIIREDKIGTLEMLISNKKPKYGTHILLYGAPGNGKTEFARSLGRKLGLKIYEIKILTDKDEKEKNQTIFRQQAYLACQKIVDKQHSLIVVDEADSLLNSSSPFFFPDSAWDTGHINKLLDDSKGITVWITNRYENISESTRRRFDYAIKFDQLTFKQRKNIWNNRLTNYQLNHLFTPKQIEELSEKYELSAGGIDLVLRNLAKMKGLNRKGVYMDILETIIHSHLQLMKGDQQEMMIKNEENGKYSTEGLHIHGEVDKTLQYLDRYNEIWASGKEQVNGSITALFFGPPGTGKTEFARYLARRLKRKLVVKKASDFLNPYIGVTEKNIAGAFREARIEQAILLIDEADSFLFSRESAVRSWEVSMVNEMLVNLENHRGMVICATNFKKMVDEAAIRRFQFKLYFDYLTAEGNLIFYHRFFDRLSIKPLTSGEEKEIKSIKFLTPGDFHLVSGYASFLDSGTVTHSFIIQELRKEVRMKNEKVKTYGF